MRFLFFDDDSFFDDNYVFYEVKAGKENYMKQFIKEKNMLLFFKNVYEERLSENKTMSFHIYMRKKKLPVLTMNGRATGGEDVRLSCTWVNGKTKDECWRQWLNIIKMLAHGSLVLAFKKKLSVAFKKDLEKNNFFDYMDEVKYDPRQDIYLRVAFLEKAMSQLSIA
jgi:hypothetical protein